MKEGLVFNIFKNDDNKSCEIMFENRLAYLV